MFHHTDATDQKSPKRRQQFYAAILRIDRDEYRCRLLLNLASAANLSKRTKLTSLGLDHPNLFSCAKIAVQYEGLKIATKDIHLLP